MRIHEEENEVQGEINIVPMIDAIFSILAFFIISSLTLVRSQGLPVNLPSAQTSQVNEREEINITVQDNGRVFLDGQAITVETIATQVSSLIPENQQAMVIINADESVSHGIVVSVMDQLRQVEGATLAIATESPQ
ncbi:outer membrane transport energization protein ExbD [Cyanobacterium stanieri PCC 7202]|uniref:Outer membrane transport energization protein ExbD n=1 Tax=Cyanobacterium stanieri (strain ATCC 29140 / PCC 7202) TaxID=292563 RepID=K9YJP2_CYASC|nr:outer membrane transport energization protein ExbD [Cyanobacterium stanieri PCC 7202]